MTTTCTVCELHAESTFKIEGMDCREEVAILERRFKNLIGLEAFSADLMGQRLHVKYDAAKISTAAIADAVADTGMRVWLDHEEPVVGSDRQMRVRQALVWTSGVALAIGMAFQFAAAGHSLALTLFIVSLAASVGATWRKAWTAARVGAMTEAALIDKQSLPALDGRRIGHRCERLLLRFGGPRQQQHRGNRRQRHERFAHAIPSRAVQTASFHAAHLTAKRRVGVPCRP
jgi:copper chaperone CopZ